MFPLPPLLSLFFTAATAPCHSSALNCCSTRKNNAFPPHSPSLSSLRVQSPTLTSSLTHSLALTHSLTYSLTCSLTHSFARPLASSTLLWLGLKIVPPVHSRPRSCAQSFAKWIRLMRGEERVDRGRVGARDEAKGRVSRRIKRRMRRRRMKEKNEKK